MINKTIEQWTRWEPIPNLAEKYYIDSLTDDANRFSLVLSDMTTRGKNILIAFENNIYIYRLADEFYKKKLLYELDKRYGSDLCAKWTFFKVTNSLYTQWISEQSYGLSNTMQFTHFSIIGGNEVVDILSRYEPKVQFLNSSQENL
ncbi:MAG TPA: hypothetical protein VHA52_09085 [Candidatus Babeliaceae bacterium]|nr:hypothetical protein [Candidatus Babeliaceae bacterium]